MLHNRFERLTLGEMLTVVGIVVALAAIVLPVWAQEVIFPDRMNACMSNMRELARGCQLFAEDNDGFLPPSRDPSTYGSNETCQYKPEHVTWRRSIQPYLPDYDVWRCPNNPNNNQVTEDGDSRFKISYGANGVRWGEAPLPVASIGRPAETVLLLESTWACADLGDWTLRKSDPDACQWGRSVFQHRRESGGPAHWGFFDGHFKPYNMIEIMLPIGPRGGPDTYNFMGREDDGDNTYWTGGTWNLDKDEKKNICPLYWAFQDGHTKWFKGEGINTGPYWWFIKGGGRDF